MGKRERARKGKRENRAIRPKLEVGANLVGPGDPRVRIAEQDVVGDAILSASFSGIRARSATSHRYPVQAATVSQRLRSGFQRPEQQLVDLVGSSAAGCCWRCHRWSATCSSTALAAELLEHLDGDADHLAARDVPADPFRPRRSSILEMSESPSKKVSSMRSPEESSCLAP